MSQPRFGVWALEEGSFGSPTHPDDPHDASWRRVRNQILLAEELGYDATLIAQLFISPFGEDKDQLEAWTLAAALAAITERIEIIAAVKPYIFHPVVLAKMALQIEQISGGRFALNVVNGWFTAEAQRAGISFFEHDERYAYGREWIEVVEPLLRGERVHHEGRWFAVDGYQHRPGPETRERPRLYFGGESPAARDLVADAADTWFLNGQPLERVEALVADVRSRRRAGAPLAFGLSAFVVARETDEEALDALAEHWSYEDGVAWEFLKDKIDPKAVMHQTFAEFPHVGSNGGTAAGLVGSYDTVTERIRQFHAAGIELFMLQFQPFEAEMTRFAEEVIPRVRRLSAVPA